MRHRNKIKIIAAAAITLLAVQSAFGAEPSFSASSNVIVAGQSSSDGVSGTSAPGTNPGGPGVSGTVISGPMGAPGSSGQMAPGSNGQTGPDVGVPAPVQNPGNESPSGVSGVISENAEMAPAGDEGTVLSPVVTAGSDDAAAEEAAKQQAAAEEAARQQAAVQAAEEAARQQAAAQAAEEAAKQQAQAGGRHIDPSKPMVALTFDDGPQPSVGNRIMDCLAQYGGKATFFMVGDRVASRKEEVQRMVAEGHEVANHTMNHKYLQKQGAAEIQAQVVKGNDAIEAACGVRPKILRLPGGNHNATVRANTHMPMIQWNIDTLDWKTKNADKTVAAVLDHVKDGDIVLMHELYSQSGDAALRIIPELHRRGFQMVTVSEMAAAKGVTLEAGKVYSSFK